MYIYWSVSLLIRTRAITFTYVSRVRGLTCRLRPHVLDTSTESTRLLSAQGSTRTMNNNPRVTEVESETPRLETYA